MTGTEAKKDSLEKVIDNYRLTNEKIMNELLKDQNLSEFNDELKELHKRRIENIKLRNKLYYWSRTNKDSALIYNSKYQLPSYFYYDLASDDLFEGFISKESHEKSQEIINQLNSRRKTLIPLFFALFLFTVLIGYLVYLSQKNTIRQYEIIKTNAAILSKAQEISKTGSWERDILNKKLTFSDEFYKIFETEKGSYKLDFSNFNIRIHPEDREKVLKIHNNDLVNNKPYICDYRLLFDDSRVKYIEEQTDIIYDETGKPAKSVGIIVDVTLKIESLNKIIQSEKVFQDLFENIQDGVYKSTLEGKFIDVNPAMVKMLGYINKQELIEIDIRKDLYYSEKDREKALKDEELGKISVLRLKKKDGSEIYVEDRSYNICDSKGNVLYNQGILRDVTEKLKAERELKEREQFNRGLLNSLTQHIAVINSKGDIVAVNEAWNEFAKENGDTTLMRTSAGTNYIDVCLNSIANGDKTAAEALAGIKSVIDKKSKFFSMEYPCHSPIEERWFFLRASMFKTGENLVVISHSDISTRKKAELERERITKDLITRNKDLEHFTFIVSHNLRAPVATIMGIADLITNPEITEDVRQMTQKGLTVSTLRLDEVVKDLNSILQIREQVHEKKSDVDLRQILAQVEQNLILLIENTQTIIKADFNTFDSLYSIKSYIFSIFYHLITNSIKYSQKNIAPIIEITTLKDEKYHSIRFKDNGIGFNLEQDRDKIFGLYNRFNPEIDGKGLGLYLVKMQIESLGGSIYLNSEINKGTEFLIQFEV